MSTFSGAGDDLDADIDSVIEKIDAVLPLLHRKAVKRGDTPTSGFRPENIRRTQRRFVDLSADSLLTRSGQDIRLEDATPAHGQYRRRA